MPLKLEGDGFFTLPAVFVAAEHAGNQDGCILAFPWLCGTLPRIAEGSSGAAAGGEDACKETQQRKFSKIVCQHDSPCGTFAIYLSITTIASGCPLSSTLCDDKKDFTTNLPPFTELKDSIYWNQPVSETVTFERISYETF